MNNHLCTFWPILKNYTSEYRTAWSIYSTSSNYPPFLSSPTVQNKHKGAALQAFFPFFLTKGPGQLKQFHLTKEHVTQTIPNNDIIPHVNSTHLRG